MTGITSYNFNGADVRTIVLPNGEPGFVGKDVCDRLGYANHSDAIKRHCKGVVLHYPLATTGGTQDARILTEPDVLRLIISSKLPAAQEFERWVFEEVLPSIRRTGQYTAPAAKASGTIVTPATEQMQLVTVLADMLRLEGSSRLKLATDATRLLAPALVPILPVYAVDAPRDGVAAPVSSLATASLTELLRVAQIEIPAARMNLRLESAGLLKRLHRPSTSTPTGTKAFWSLTEAGLQFGKNIVSPTNPRETQPHYYRAKFEELLELLNI